jgi:hypothetical protein
MTGQYPRTYDSSLTNRWRVRELLSHIDNDPLQEEKVCSIEKVSPGTRAETSDNGTQRPGQRSGHHGLRAWA